MTSCDLVRETLGAIVDGEISALERQTVDAHLAACTACSRDLSALRAVHQRLGALPRSGAPSSLRARVVALSREDGVSVARPATAGSFWSSRIPRVFRSPAFAVALIMLVAAGAFVRGSGLMLPDGLRELVAQHLELRPASGGGEVAATGDRLRSAVAAYAGFPPDPQIDGAFLDGRVARVGATDAAHFAFTDTDGRPLSLFVLPASSEAGDWGSTVQHHGKLYNVARYRGHTIVSWRQKGAFCVLLCPSTDHELLEQAHRVQTGFDENPS